MGDVSIIARRLSDKYVQYGWSGNGGYYRSVGARLLEWYQDPSDIEYLFSLGQTAMIGQIGSEHGGFHRFETHGLTGEAFWVGTTEREIFSRIAFVDYGYFYDSDYKWYYIHPGPFRIKIPLELISNNLDCEGYEFNYLQQIQVEIVKSMFRSYRAFDVDFNDFLECNEYDADTIVETITREGTHALYHLYEQYRKIYEYFDDWIVIKSDNTYTDIEKIILRKKENKHMETIQWNQE